MKILLRDHAQPASRAKPAPRGRQQNGIGRPMGVRLTDQACDGFKGVVFDQAENSPGRKIGQISLVSAGRVAGGT